MPVIIAGYEPKPQSNIPEIEVRALTIEQSLGLINDANCNCVHSYVSPTASPVRMSIFQVIIGSPVKRLFGRWCFIAVRAAAVWHLPTARRVGKSCWHGSFLRLDLIHIALVKCP